MTTRWVKMLRDAQVARGRLTLVVAALTVSLVAVVTMLSTWTVLRREVPRSYIGSNPASAQLAISGNLTPAVLDSVRRVPNVAAAELASTLSARIDVGNGEWLPLLLFVVPSFDSLRINTLHPDSGTWPAPVGTLAIERSAMELTHSSLGRAVNIELAGVGRCSITIAASVHDPGVAPAWQEQVVYGYVTSATLSALGVTEPLDVLKLVVRDGVTDPAAIERTSRSVAGVLIAAGQRVYQIRIPPPQQHPHQRQMNAIVVMLLAFSMLVLLLGAVLTGGVVSAWLAQQAREIAIMKAIGAVSTQISALYLVLVCALGGVATLLGVPIGLLLGRQFIGLVATLLNLRLESVAVPLWIYLVALALGVGAPVLAAALPIVRASRRTVRAALDDSAGRSAASAVNGLVRTVTRWRLSDPALTLAVRNTFRRRARLAMTAALLAGAGAMFIASLDLRAAWERNVATARQDRFFQLEVRLRGDASQQRVVAAIAAVPGVRTVESWGTQHAARVGSDELEIQQSYPDGGHGSFTFRAAPPQTTLIAHRMAEGRWLTDRDTNAVVINSMARALSFHDLALGDSVALRVNGRPVVVRVVGVMREPLTQATLLVTPALMALATGTPDSTNAVRVQLASGGDVTRATRDLTAALARIDVEVRSVQTEARIASAQGGHVYILVFALGFIALVMAIVGMIGLASSLGISVFERTREFGVMRAVGCSTRMIVRTVVAEGVLIALVSILAAVVASRVLSLTVGRVLASIAAQELTLTISPSGVAVWATGLLVGTVLVSSIPALRAARLTVRDALSHV